MAEPPKTVNSPPPSERVRMQQPVVLQEGPLIGVAAKVESPDLAVPPSLQMTLPAPKPTWKEKLKSFKEKHTPTFVKGTSDNASDKEGDALSKLGKNPNGSVIAKELTIVPLLKGTEKVAEDVLNPGIRMLNPIDDFVDFQLDITLMRKYQEKLKSEETKTTTPPPAAVIATTPPPAQPADNSNLSGLPSPQTPARQPVTTASQLNAPNAPKTR